MRKKNLLFLIVFLAFAIQIVAKDRTSDEAQQLAKSFVLSQRANAAAKSGAKKSAQSVVVTPAFAGAAVGMTTNMSTSSADYYAFNIGSGSGFVIISGDDNAVDVLGYADNGNISIDGMPDNMKEWLKGYAQQIESIKSSSSSKVVQKKAASSILATTSYSFFKPTYSSSVAPLLGKICYDQDAPYYYQCPQVVDTFCLVGCDATAMAQIMAKWKYPATATGFTDYITTTRGIAVTANTSSTYDWTKFSDTYSSKGNKGKDTIEIAKLMFDCGVAVQMNYNTLKNGGSGAYASDVCKAFVDNFGYGNAILSKKSNYNADKWEKTLKAEIDVGRPVLYSGSGSKGGHAFVCDGYDDTGNYHFNWGWSGAMNGYFALTALHPYNENNDFTFNVSNNMVTQIDPTISTASDANFNLSMANFFNLKTNADGSLSFGVPLYNMYVHDFSGMLALDLIDLSGNIVNTTNIGDLSIAGITGANIYGSTCSLSSFPLPSDLSDGTYFLRAKYKTTSESSWHYVSQVADVPNFLRIVKSGSTVTVDYQLNCPTDMTLNSLTTSADGLYKGGDVTFTANMTNNSSVAFNSDCAVMLVDKADTTKKTLIGKQVAAVAAGATASVSFTGTVTEDIGNYSAYLMVDTVNCPSTVVETSSLYSLGDAVDVDVCPVLNETDNTYAVEAGNYSAVKFTRTLKQAKWNTICLPFSLSSDQITSLFGAGTVVAEYNALSDANALNFVTTTNMVTNTPYLIKPVTVNADNTYSLSGEITIDGKDAGRVTCQDANGNVASLTGNFISTTVPEDSFFISNNNFYMASSTTTILKGFRAFISLLPASPSKVNLENMSFSVDDESAVTSVNVVAGDISEANDIYNLNGQLIQKGNTATDALPKGCYIMKGHKFVIK